MSTTKQMWLWVGLLPVLTFLGLNMCVWPVPRFLGVVALMLLWLPTVTVFPFLAAIPASLWFAVTGLVSRNRDGEFGRRVSKSLACLCFIGLWLLALWSAGPMRHRAFVRASVVGDSIVQALARYRTDHGEYPGTLDHLVPQYIDALPYTGMIAYPEFTYQKDYNDIQSKPGEYELRIDCTSGGINFDRFIYWPSEDYPDRIQGNGVERFRTWAYVHE